MPSEPLLRLLSAAGTAPMCGAVCVIPAADRSCSLHSSVPMRLPGLEPLQERCSGAALVLGQGQAVGHASPVSWCECRRWELRHRSRTEEVSGFHMDFTNQFVVNPGMLVMCVHSSGSVCVTPWQCVIPDSTAVLLSATAVFKLKLFFLCPK